MSQWRKKDRTKKGEVAEVDRDVTTLRSEKGDLADGGRYGRNRYAARVASATLPAKGIIVSTILMVIYLFMLV